MNEVKDLLYVFDSSKPRTSRFFVAAFLRMTLHQDRIATGVLPIFEGVCEGSSGEEVGILRELRDLRREMDRIYFGAAALRRPMAASALGLIARSTATLISAGRLAANARSNAGARSSGRSTNSP